MRSTAAANLANAFDLKTLNEAAKRKSEAIGLPAPGARKPPSPAPPQWSHETFDRLQKEGNFTDRQLRIIARTKR